MIDLWRDLICIFIPLGNENKCSPQCLHWGQEHATGMFHLRSVQISSIPANKNCRPKAAFLLAEMEGFEPPHALQRLADFESAPFSHLGTSP